MLVVYKGTSGKIEGQINMLKIGDWVVCNTDGITRLVVDIRLDGYVQLVPSMLFWHPSGLRKASTGEEVMVRQNSFESLARDYREQTFVELCRIKKWKKAYKKAKNLPIGKINAMIRRGLLPIQAAAKWNSIRDNVE